MTGENVGIVLCSLAGLLCLWALVREQRLQGELRRRGVHAEGLVVGQERMASDDPWTPVIEFTDLRGERITFTARATGTGLGLDVGSHVPVAYLPEQPETARVFTRKHRTAHLVLLPIGSVAFLGAAVLIVLTR